MIPVVPKVRKPYSKFPPRIHAITRHQVIWRFGWSKSSPERRADLNHAYTPHFLYVRALMDGRILEAVKSIYASEPNHECSFTLSVKMDKVQMIRPADDDTEELEDLKRELAEQMVILLDYQQKLLTGQIFGFLKYIEWRKDIKPFGLKLLWSRK